MLPEIVGIVLLASGAAAASRMDKTLHALSRTIACFRDAAASDAKASFRPAERAVTNWRIEAAGNLDSPPQSLANLIAPTNSPAVPRCVKLNNYWCVKRAGWIGEIAADAEGHVAFASARDGAIVTAMLLRRYYLVYHRHSAHAILSRWAPAECGGVSASRAGAPVSRPPASRQRDVTRSLAIHGIGNTLRARWLAAHKHGLAATGRIAATRRSVVADRPVKLLRAPEIAVGMGERPAERAPATLAALEPPEPLQASAPPAGATCQDESLRIHQYALRAIEGIAHDPDEDLNLFSPDGAPGANLPRLMNNMAKVEIGPLRARADLIAAAISLEELREQARRAVAGAAQSTK